MQTKRQLTTDDSDDQAALHRSADQVDSGSAGGLNGLTEAEVQDRRQRGLANVVSVTNTRSYLEIIRRNKNLERAGFGNRRTFFPGYRTF